MIFSEFSNFFRFFYDFGKEAFRDLPQRKDWIFMKDADCQRNGGMVKYQQEMHTNAFEGGYRMNTSRATLKDVAEYSGFGLRTVIKAMNGDPSVREKNRKAIFQAAEELHYTPNRAASALGKKKSVRLAVVYAHVSELYFPEIEAGLRKCLEDYCDYGLSMEFHIGTSDDWMAQNRLLEELSVREDLDGVVMQPLSATKQNAAINTLVHAGKPVSIFGTDAPESKRLCYVSCDAYRAGRIGGQLLERTVPQNGCVCVMNSSFDQIQILRRAQGCIDRLKQARPDLRLLVNWDINARIFEPTLREMLDHHQIHAIFCDDAQTVTAAKVLKERKQRDITLVGFDHPQETEQYMREGFVHFALDQRPETFSYQAAKQLFCYLADGTVPEPVSYTPIYILTSECL